MPDVPIVNRASVTAPKDYTLPQSQEIILKAVKADIDGTGAGGTWLPALQLVSNNGDVMWTACDTSSPQAAGGSVTVTWFPGVRTTGAGSLSNPGLMAARVNIVGNLNIPEGDPGVRVSWGEAPVDTGTPTPFWNATNPTRLTAPVDGIYLSLGNLEWDQLAAANAPAYVGTYLYKNGTASPNFFYEYNTAEAAVDNVARPYNLTGGSHGIFSMNAGDYFEILAYNFNEGNAARNLIDLRPTQNHYCSWQMILVSTL